MFSWLELTVDLSPSLYNLWYGPPNFCYSFIKCCKKDFYSAILSYRFHSSSLRPHPREPLRHMLNQLHSAGLVSWLNVKNTCCRVTAWKSLWGNCVTKGYREWKGITEDLQYQICKLKVLEFILIKMYLHMSISYKSWWGKNGNGWFGLLQLESVM